jgi:hypothetical protein
MAVPLVFLNAKEKPDSEIPVQTKPFPLSQWRSETATTATTLSAGRVGGSRSNVLNAADLHASTGKSTESRLSTGSRGLGTVTWRDSSKVSNQSPSR